MLPQAHAVDLAAAPFPLGAHLTTPRHGFVHHGIYIGGGRVVHYAGWRRGCRGPVEEVSLDRFSRGRAIAMQPWHAAEFDSCEIVARARSRLGEDLYRLLANNCEHFCTWCAHGVARSAQAEAWLQRFDAWRKPLLGLLSPDWLPPTALRAQLDPQ
jgi:Lecithin retinol acyltransferase